MGEVVELALRQEIDHALAQAWDRYAIRPTHMIIDRRTFWGNMARRGEIVSRRIFCRRRFFRIARGRIFISSVAQ